MYERKILPFYMTYPLPLYYQEEDTILSIFSRCIRQMPENIRRK